MKRLKKYNWLPPLLMISGIAFYVYDGLKMNSWLVNLPNIIIYFVIVLALYLALRKREQLRSERVMDNEE